MKKTLVAMAAFAAVSSFAQSSVTIFGVADAWFGSLKQASIGATGAQNTASQTMIGSGGLSGGRLGFRGTEDLGGGMKANFMIETAFGIDAPGATTLGNRQTFVNVESGFGTIGLGRHYSAYDSLKSASTIMGVTAFDSSNGYYNTFATTAAPAGYSGTLASAALGPAPTTAPTAAQAAAFNAAVYKIVAGNIGAWAGHEARINNSVRYDSPNMSGFTGSFVYGLGENKTTTTGATSSTSFNLRYSNGPIAVGLGHQADILLKTATSSLKYNNTLVSGSYDLGVAKLGLAINNAKSSFAGVSGKRSEWLVGVSMPLGATTLQAQYASGKDSGAGNGADTSLGFQAIYALSKRTNMYGGFNTTSIDKANVNGTDAKNTIFAVGVRHTF